MNQQPSVSHADLVLQAAYIQAIYDKFIAIGITLQLSEMPVLIHQALNDRGEPSFNDMVITKLLTLAQYTNVMALGLSRNKTLTLIDLPDYQHIQPSIQDTVRNMHAWEVQVNHMTIINGVVTPNY